MLKNTLAAIYKVGNEKRFLEILFCVEFIASSFLILSPSKRDFMLFLSILVSQVFWAFLVGHHTCWMVMQWYFGEAISCNLNKTINAYSSSPHWVFQG